MGDELRATTITATGPQTRISRRLYFPTSILQRFITLPKSVQNLPRSCSAGNTVEQKRTLSS